MAETSYGSIEPTDNAEEIIIPLVPTTKPRNVKSHSEDHFGDNQLLQDIVLGMSDGLTVPFALAAGLTSAFSSSRYVLVAGIAELAAGSISMGLGGYMAGRTELLHYESERKKEVWEVQYKTEAEIKEIYEIFEPYGLKQKEIQGIVDYFMGHPEQWVDFMMRFELGLDKPDASTPLKSAVAVGSAYVLGGLIPLLPYFFVPDSSQALLLSVAVTLLALFVFGFVKGKIMGHAALSSGVETLITGAAAAAAAFLMAKWFNGLSHSESVQPV